MIQSTTVRGVESVDPLPQKKANHVFLSGKSSVVPDAITVVSASAWRDKTIGSFATLPMATASSRSAPMVIVVSSRRRPSWLR